jgi:Uma2 family endonuclease
MSMALPASLTLDAFLDWERRQDGRFEFDGFRPVAMTGGSFNHATIQRNLIGQLYAHLRGHPCAVFGSELKVRTRTGIRYPDAFVVCPPFTAGADVIDNPTIVFEIISPSPAVADRIDKNQEYRDTAAIRRYVILEQDKPAATVFTRQGEDWIGHLQIGDTTLELPEIGLSLRLADLYEGTVIPSADA